MNRIARGIAGLNRTDAISRNPQMIIPSARQEDAFQVARLSSIKRNHIKCSAEARRARALLPQVLQRFEIVDDVCHGSSYAFTRTDRRQVRDLLASAARQC